MKILLLHNFLRPPSGENTVFTAERDLLQSKKGNCITYEKNNADITGYSLFQKLKTPFQLYWSRESYKEIRAIIKEEQPDIAHFHNTFPLISPSAYYACHDEGIPTIQTLHNHRLFCPCGYFLRDGKICKDCMTNGLWQSVVHGCYHQSRLQTCWLAGMLGFHRIIKTWDAKVDLYIALTNFAKNLYSTAGLPEEKIVVKPNFVPDFIKYRKKPESFGIFIGRLGTEKGVDTLLSALEIAGQIPFKIIGDGPERNKLEESKSDLKLYDTDFCGRKNREETLSILGRASFLVLPSICYEGFPMVIVEALSMGVPVITTDLGGAPEIINDGSNGFIVPPEDADALASKMSLLMNDTDLCKRMGVTARKDYEQHYTPMKNLEMLMEIYNGSSLRLNTQIGRNLSE